MSESRPAGRKIVLMGCDPNPFYWFFLPSTTAMWAAIGYRAHYVLSGALGRWDGEGIEDALLSAQKLGASFTYLRWEDPSKFCNGTMAQVSRLFGGYLGSSTDDYILTGDIDLWPLTRDFYHSQDFAKDVHMFHGHAYQDLDYERYPMCHVGARMSTWRQLVPATGDTITQRVINELFKTYGTENRPGVGWGWDEDLLVRLLNAWSGWKDRVQFLDPPGYPEIRSRLDRGDWHDPMEETLTDCHCIRPGYLNWMHLEPVLERLVPKGSPDWEIVHSFATRFIESNPPTS